ncbi:MAG: hypothetical protein HYX48_01645 [Chlamydiales bacterium]|nr:hypothetical protein [Chlamydiales bacterium]
MKRLAALLLPLLAAGCSNLEQSEDEKMRKQNAKGEYIQRHESEYQFKVESPKMREREKYPWEEPQKSSQK